MAEPMADLTCEDISGRWILGHQEWRSWAGEAGKGGEWVSGGGLVRPQLRSHEEGLLDICGTSILIRGQLGVEYPVWGVKLWSESCVWRGCLTKTLSWSVWGTGFRGCSRCRIGRKHCHFTQCLGLHLVSTEHDLNVILLNCVYLCIMNI